MDFTVVYSSRGGVDVQSTGNRRRSLFNLEGAGLRTCMEVRSSDFLCSSWKSQHYL